MKRKLSFIIFVIMIISTVGGYAATPVSNGGKGDMNKIMTMEQNQFMMKDGMNMFNVRMVADAFGGMLKWDNTTKMLTIMMEEKTFMFKAGDKFVMLDGKKMAIYAPLTIMKGRSYLSEMVLKDVLGINAEYADGRVNLTKAIKMDIIETAVASGQFKTLAAAINAADLATTLKGEGPFTVFAPTDAAFAKLPAGTVEKLIMPENKAQLVDILTYHAVSGKYMAADVTKMDKLMMINGKEAKIEIKDGKAMIDGAYIIMTDIIASNGTIHVIDAVMMP